MATLNCNNDSAIWQDLLNVSFPHDGQMAQPPIPAQNQNNHKQTRAQKQQEYRERVRANPERYAHQKEVDRLRAKRRRMNRSEDEKKKDRELSKERSRRYYRAKMLASGREVVPREPNPERQRMTKAEKWRETKRRQMAAMSEEKKKEMNERRRKRYAERKEQKTLKVRVNQRKNQKKADPVPMAIVRVEPEPKVIKPLTPEEKRKQAKARKQQEYRQRMKADPEKYERQKEADKLRSMIWRWNRSEEQKERDRENARVRNCRYRAVKKLKATGLDAKLAKEHIKANRAQFEIKKSNRGRPRLSSSAGKAEGNRKAEKGIKKTEKWKEDKRRQRAAMSEEKKEQMKQRRRELYAKRKAEGKLRRRSRKADSQDVKITEFVIAPAADKTEQDTTDKNGCMTSAPVKTNTQQ